MKLILALLACTPCYAQTASVPSQPVTGTAAIPAVSMSCTVPKNGGTCRFNIPASAAPVTAATKPVSAPVSLAGYTGKVACSFASFIINPDQTITITGMQCTVTQ